MIIEICRYHTTIIKILYSFLYDFRVGILTRVISTWKLCNVGQKKQIVKILLYVQNKYRWYYYNPEYKKSNSFLRPITVTHVFHKPLDPDKLNPPVRLLCETVYVAFLTIVRRIGTVFTRYTLGL